MMTKFWTTLGDIFGLSFNVIDFIGNKMNYVYIGIIFIFLVVWTIIMFKHKRNNEEHAPL